MAEKYENQEHQTRSPKHDEVQYNLITIVAKINETHINVDQQSYMCLNMLLGPLN